MAWRPLSSIAIQWSVIVIAFVLAVRLSTPLAYIGAALVIATRRMALSVIVHDAAHGLILPSKRANDIVADWLAAFPCFMSTSAFRRFHLQHHRALGTADDPERLAAVLDPRSWTWPVSRREFARTLILDLTGLNLARTLSMFAMFSPLTRLVARPERMAEVYKDLVGFGLYWTVALAAASLSGAIVPFVLLWVLPHLTLQPVLIKLARAPEHVGADGWSTVTVRPRLAERMLFSPLNIQYHGEHHAFPNVPYYNLPRLHRRVSRVPVNPPWEVVDGYFGRDGAVSRLLS